METKCYFYKGRENTLEKIEKKGLEEFKEIKDAFTKILDGKNLSFLLGCGCSSHYVDGKETGIPTMNPLAEEFYKLSLTESAWLKSHLNLDIEADYFKNNLENFLGALHSQYFFYEATNQTSETKAIEIKRIINSVKQFLIKKCLNEGAPDTELQGIYTSFYRKLLFRNTNLPKTNIFTTNYDLYSERALDRLAIHYVNGFSGGISRYFNPTIFNYALAERMDLTQSKWSVIDNFIYLYKLHGSLNWVQSEDSFKLFKVREIQDTTLENLSKHNEVAMIHPTPLKYNASLGSPYSDLFREFQRKLMQNNNVLVTIGYSFSDEHINNLIFQAFTIPSFRLIIIGDVESNKHFEKIKELDDPRIWIIGGQLSDGTKLHYFKGFVENVLPDLSNDEFENKLDKTFLELLKLAGS